MGTWNDPPQVPPVPPLAEAQEGAEQIKAIHSYMKKMANVLSSLSKDLEFMLNGHLDVKNIRAEGVEARSIKAGAIETDKIAAGAVVADKIDVAELSAISADLGHITAGLVEAIKMVSSTIIGSYIGTKEPGIYPRTEMSATDGYFGAFETEDKHIRIVEDYLGQGVTLVFVNGFFGGGSMYMGSDKLYVKGQNDLGIEANGNITFDSLGTRGCVFNSWSGIYSNGDGQSLRQALDSINTQLASINSSISSLAGLYNSLNARVAALEGA